jgi:hypothetical protein
MVAIGLSLSAAAELAADREFWPSGELPGLFPFGDYLSNT